MTALERLKTHMIMRHVHNDQSDHTLTRLCIRVVVETYNKQTEGKITLYEWLEEQRLADLLEVDDEIEVINICDKHEIENECPYCALDEAREQIDKLANFIIDEVDGEPSQSEGAIDCAIRIIKAERQANKEHLRQITVLEEEVVELQRASLDNPPPLR